MKNIIENGLDFTVKSVEEIKRQYNFEMKALDRLALFITRRVGTMGFFLLIFLWTISWLSWNTLGPIEHRFDPYPAFVLWLFISNMIQIFLMPLLLIGQNIQGRASEKRTQYDFEIDKKAEKEIGEILVILKDIQEKIKK
jgi:uncharacterized membrane protein